MKKSFTLAKVFLLSVSGATAQWLTPSSPIYQLAAATGITWHSPAPTTYGVFKPAGPWTAPNYQQLNLSWETGIILSPGTEYGKSYVDIQGGGLRVTQGCVGIGTITPSYKLSVAGGAIGLDADHPLKGGGKSLISGNPTAVTVGTTDTGVNLRFDAGASNRIFVNGATGNVGIGTSVPDAKLAVDGTVHAEKIRVDATVPAPDYVFESNYPLTSLHDLRIFIENHKHLPDVPSASEMEKSGVDLNEMDMILLKKVEELTLHLIDLHQEIESLKLRKQ